jgi:hypothetical protein
MEPSLVTRPEDHSVLEELRRREPIFHRPEYFGSRADIETATAADFWEVGASGRRYSRAYVLETLAARAEEPVEDDFEASDFHCRALCGDVYLLTYTLLQGARLTRRSTIWRRTPHGWQILFHQGTVVADED